MDETSVENGAVDNEELCEKFKQLEMQNKKIQAEFNMQRAKLKELYVQKELEYVKCLNENSGLRKELDEMKSQFFVAECKTENEMLVMDRRAQEEISSLQQMVQETIEESSVCKTELEKYQEENSRLKQVNQELREELYHQQHDSPSLAPVLSHVKKTLARKLGADSSGSHDSLDDSMRKAQEDAEVLRSLVVPLEEEIKALKEKLRSTDEELQVFRNQSSQDITTSPTLLQPTCSTDCINQSTSMEFQCEACKTFEDKLANAVKLCDAKKEKIDILHKNIEDSKEELKKEAALRRDLEEQWQEKRDLHKNEVQLLTEQVKKGERELINLQQQFLDTKEEIAKQFIRLADDRVRVNKHLEILQSDNDFLSGRYLATSEELEMQLINFPNDVEELHELLLRQQNDLIQARVGCELEKRKCVSCIDETQILRAQLESDTAERRHFEKKIQTTIKSLEERLRDAQIKEATYVANKESFDRKEVTLNKHISELRVQIIELQEANEKLDKINIDYKSKIKNMQDDLANSEHVQKDFVKLSQNLQMSLEKLRQADTEVRWQNDEDVDNCPNCNIFFTVTTRKHHCRHCGSIYCEKCLSKCVPSGPRKKPTRVCDICHTLLTPNTAPYFSHEPPQST